MANRLAHAISPYLRSHSDNPVDWYPWGSEAFEVARRRDVPVLVSIGYATCHWCHVMARESFSDPTLAEQLNSRFVAIKVDREENPEVDTVYITAAGAFTQNLGWPLNVFVTPDGHPFYAGTYFPPAPIQGVPAFRQVLDAVSEAWTANREGVRESSGRLAEGIRAAARGTARVPLPDEDALRAAVRDVAIREDRVHGGFGQQPKFPVSPVLGFLARMRTKDQTAGVLLDRTLAAMARSGLRDPVEGGFFRYATRADWSEPHYERMLYDNAQLLELYSASAVQAPNRADAELFRHVAGGIAAFLLDVMRVRGGGFASAQDSESVVDGRRVEGFYYSLDAASRARIAAPALDEKVLTGWNGWAVEALARAGFRLEEPAWIRAAEHVANFLLREHQSADGRLVRASLDGRLSDAPATSEDYGGFASALLTLGALTGRVDYAAAGRDLVDESLAGRRSGDPLLAEQGMSWTDDPSDGAYPSGPSALAHACVLAHQLTGAGEYRDRAAVLLAAAGDTAQQPFAFGAALATTVELTDEVELVVVGTDPSLLTMARHFRGLVSVVTPEQAEALASAGFSLYEGRTAEAAYYCLGGVCRLPVTSAAELEGILRG